MGRAGQALKAIRDGWTVTYRQPKLFFGTLLSAAALTLLPVTLLLASRSSAPSAGDWPLFFAVVVALLAGAVLATSLYGAVIVGAADALAGRQVSLTNGMRVTVRKLPAVITWGVLTTIVHSIVPFRTRGAFSVGWKPGDLLLLLFDALTFIVLPALLLDPAGRGLRNAFGVAQRSFLPSLLAALLFRVAVFGLVLAIIGTQLALAGTGTAFGLVLAFGMIVGVVAFAVLFTLQLAARAALYRLSEEPVAAPAAPISGIAGALN